MYFKNNRWYGFKKENDGLIRYCDYNRALDILKTATPKETIIYIEKPNNILIFKIGRNGYAKYIVNCETINKLNELINIIKEHNKI